METLDLEKQAELLTCEKTALKEIALLLESLQHQVAPNRYLCACLTSTLLPPGGVVHLLVSLSAPLGLRLAQTSSRSNYQGHL